MIKQSTVLMATPIAMLATEKGLDLHDKALDIIKGLNETTANIASFTEENIATELPDYTALVPDHTETLDMASTIVADTIRSALYTVSKVIKPILVDTQEKLKGQLSASNATDTIFNQLQIDLVNIEPAFLNSPFYPKEAPPTFAGIDSIRLSNLLQGSWPRLTGSELVEMIAVEVDTLRTFFSSPAEVQNVYDALFIEKNWWTVFTPDCVKDGVAMIDHNANYRFESFRTLVIASLLLNKLVSIDDPLSGVTDVSLEDYRASLRLTRDLLSTMLARFRNLWENRAAAGIIILDQAVKYDNQPHSDIYSSDGSALQGIRYLSGRLTIGYNTAVLEMFAQADELSLTEYVIGYLYAKNRGYNVKDIITDRDVVKAAWVEYRNDVTQAIMTNKNNVARKVFMQVLDGLYSKEEYKPLIDAMSDDVAPNQRVQTRLASHIDIGLFFNNIPLLDSIIRGDNSLMNTYLAAKLADVFDCPIAEEILTLNANNPVGSVEQQRKALSHSIDKVIINRLFAR